MDFSLIETHKALPVGILHFTATDCAVLICFALLRVVLGLQEKGHAESMNLIIKMTSTRYLLYIEDDWLPLSKPLVPQSFLQPLLAVRHTSLDAAVSLWDFVSVAISILRKQGDAVCTDFDCLEDRSIVQVSVCLLSSIMSLPVPNLVLSLLAKDPPCFVLFVSLCFI